jgi:hypothetical protein
VTYHHPSEMVPEPPDGYVIQSPYVAALMDTGTRVLQLDAEASVLHEQQVLFGEDFHDFVRGGPIDLDTAHDMAAKIYEQDPGAWASAARTSLLMVQTSEDQEDLQRSLTHHAAVVTAWLTAVQRRTPVGAAS